jgi:flagellar hook-length control protein FliK
MTTSPVHLAPSRSPATAAAATSAAQSAAAGNSSSRASTFDLLFALQLGAGGGSFVTPTETVPGTEALEAAATEGNPVAATVDPAQWMWPPMMAMAGKNTPESATVATEAGAESVLAAGDAASAGKRRALEDPVAVSSDESDPAAAGKTDAGTGLAAAPDKPAFMMPTASTQGDNPLQSRERNVKTESASPVGVTSAPPQPAPLSPAAQAAVQAPVGTAAFADQMAQQVAVFVDQKQLTAQVQVHPPELGPVEVQIKINADQVQVDFFATQADTRDALETAIPRLKEMLAEQGLSLSGSHVGTRDESGRFAQAFAQGESSRRGSEDPAAVNANDAQRDGRGGEDGAPAINGPLHHRLGVPRLVDTFA